MRLKKFLGITLALGIVVSALPVNANAAESVSTSNTMVEEIDLEKQTGYMGTVNSEDFKPLPSDIVKSIKSKRNSDIMSAAASEGDAYEPNNNVSLATNYMKGKLVSANLHNNTDVDFYKFEVFSDDVNNEVLYSFVLTGIPLQCDYDMYVANSDLQAVADIKTGSESEQMILTFNQPGTYYVLIRSSDGSYNATSNYKLYFGPTYKNDTTGWKSTGLKFNFPNKDRGKDENYVQATTGWLIYDGFRTDSSIPSGSLVHRFYLDAEGTGTWGGFYKIIKPASHPSEQISQLGGLSVFDMEEGKYAVKQQWAMTGIVNYAYSFIWKPNICIDYKYPVTIQNMSFVK